ncbi:MAG: alpha/beta hydrolase [Deltaproteobacteria bacterium]|nr:alpha/beta hydrolase [Deltaproteobacteria bacterium]
MPFVQANGVKIYYELHGQGEPLVLIAGLGCDHTLWSEVIDSLSRQFQILIFDNRAVGQSEGYGHPFSIQELAEDTAALMTVVGFQKAHVLGHSMGGAIAQYMALNYAERVQKLMICCSASRFGLLAHIVLNTAVKFMQANVPIDLCIENMLPWVFSGDYLADAKKRKSAMDRMLNNPHPQLLDGFVNQVASAMAFDVVSRLSEIRLPTMVMATEQDILTPIEDARLTASGIKDARLVIIRDSGHSVMLEKPQEFVKEIVSFLAV